MANREIVRISDCTLKQRKDLPDLSFREKLELCRLMDRLNADIIELNGIHHTRIDSLLIKSVSTAVRNSGLAVPVELNADSVSAVWEALKGAAHPRLQVPAPVSSVQMEYLYHMKPKTVIQAVVTTISACSEYTRDVEFVAEDATRSDPAFLREIIAAAKEIIFIQIAEMLSFAVRVLCFHKPLDGPVNIESKSGGDLIAGSIRTRRKRAYVSRQISI